MSRLLREMGRTSQAEEHEDFIRQETIFPFWHTILIYCFLYRLWLKTHPYTFPPNVFKSLVIDKMYRETDYIYDHADVKNCLHGIWLGWSRTWTSPLSIGISSFSGSTSEAYHNAPMHRSLPDNLTAFLWLYLWRDIRDVPMFCCDGRWALMPFQILLAGISCIVSKFDLHDCSNMH